VPSSTARSNGQTLQAFDPTVPAGPPTGLPKRVAWASASNAAFFLALGANIKAACDSRGFDYVTTNANNNPQTYVQQQTQLLTRGVGAMAVVALDPASQAAPQLQGIQKGVGVMGVVASPATMIANTDQYAVGHAQGQAAVDYIKASLGGKANVIYLNSDSAGPEIKKRHRGVLAALASGGEGIKVVLDIEAPITSEGGFAAVNTAIQAHPEINVFLGGDSPMVGAFQAVTQSGKMTDTMYFGGIDGDPQALALIAKGGAYRTSHGFGWQIMGYVIGQRSCDWIEGKSIPRALLIPPVELTKATIDTYNTDMAQPAEVLADAKRLARYITQLGNIDSSIKDQYWKENYSPGS